MGSNPTEGTNTHHLSLVRFTAEERELIGDAATAGGMTRRLLDPSGGLMSPERTVVVATRYLPNDIRCPEPRIGRVR